MHQATDDKGDASMLLGEDEAQAEIEARVAWRIVVARGRAAIASPAAAAIHAVIPTRFPVLAPLIYIATHVEKPKYIRCLTGYFMCA